METWYTTSTVFILTGQNHTGLFTPPVSKMHLRVAKLWPRQWPTWNWTVLSRRLLSPEWDKNLDVCVPPFSKPIHCQLDPPAGEYFFVSMTIKEERKRMVRKSFQEARVLFNRASNEKANQTTFVSFIIFQESNLVGWPGWTDRTPPPVKPEACYLKQFGCLKTQVSYLPSVWPAC